MADSTARSMWRLFEPIHDVTYFAREIRKAGASLGLEDFWMTYFAFRSAPLGRAAPAVVTAAFNGFHPTWVKRALPEGWDEAVTNLVDRGLVEPLGDGTRPFRLTSDGRELKEAVERDTDRLAEPPWSALPLETVHALGAVPSPLANAVRMSDEVPDANPVGLGRRERTGPYLEENPTVHECDRARRPPWRRSRRTT